MTRFFTGRGWLTLGVAALAATLLSAPMLGIHLTLDRCVASIGEVLP